MMGVFLVVVLTKLLQVCAASCKEGTGGSSATEGKAQKFGHAMRHLFQLEDGYTNYNHGSFGATPKSVWKAQQEYTKQAEAKPDDWFRGGYQKILSNVRQRVANYINATEQSVVLVENASAGVNAMIRSLSLNETHTILMLNLAYPMVKHTVTMLDNFKRSNAMMVHVPLPVSGPEDIVAAVRTTLEANKDTKIQLAVFSHIVSVPGIILPVAELAKLCKEHKVANVVIDGAHALGQIPLDMTELEKSGVDGWVGNGHKWLYSPKGSAVLWVSEKLQPIVVPNVISSEWAGTDDFPAQYTYTGTRDYTAFCAIGDAMDFRESLGEDALIEYTHNLAVEGQALLLKMWETKVMAPPSMIAFLFDVQLPSDDEAKVKALNAKYAEKYGSFIVTYKADDDTWWTRMSSQVYLELEDFQLVGERILELLK